MRRIRDYFRISSGPIPSTLFLLKHLVPVQQGRLRADQVWKDGRCLSYPLHLIDTHPSLSHCLPGVNHIILTIYKSPSDHPPLPFSEPWPSPPSLQSYWIPSAAFSPPPISSPSHEPTTPSTPSPSVPSTRTSQLPPSPTTYPSSIPLLLVHTLPTTFEPSP